MTFSPSFSPFLTILPVNVIVSAPLPAGQPPFVAFVLAAVIASARLQVSFTVMLAA